VKTFKDAAGRTWTLSITIGTAMRVKDKLEVHLLRPDEGRPPLLTRLALDEMFLAEVLCCLLEDQFEAHKVTERDVQMAFDGETLLAAQTALYDELASFFLSRGRRHVTKAVRKQQAVIEKATALAETKIDAIDVDQLTRGAMSGSSPAASDSTPDPSR